MGVSSGRRPFEECEAVAFRQGTQLALFSFSVTSAQLTAGEVARRSAIIEQQQRSGSTLPAFCAVSVPWTSKQHRQRELLRTQQIAVTGRLAATQHARKQQSGAARAQPGRKCAARRCRTGHRSPSQQRKEAGNASEHVPLTVIAPITNHSNAVPSRRR